MSEHPPGNNRRGRPWWPIPPPPPPTITLATIAGQIRDLSGKLDRLLQCEAADSQTTEKGFETLMAQIDVLIEDISGLSDDLTAFKTDFDAAVAALQAQNVPADLQPAIDRLLAARQKLADLDASAKALVPPTPTPAP